MTPRAPTRFRQVSPFRAFGRRAPAVAIDAGAISASVPPHGTIDELRLFALTFAAGFLFMTVYLA
jgi:hypothetical protein